MYSTTITCTKSRYGWKSDAQAAGGSTCYAGKVWNGSATRHYDSSLRFIPPSSPPWGNYPIVISKITLTTTKKSGTLSNLYTYLSTTEASYPGSFTAIPNKSIASFNSGTITITDSDALAQINKYLVNKTTFFLHINRSIDGGTFYGGGDSKRPYIVIEWDYAASSGSLNTTSFTAGSSVNLTLNVKGTGYHHRIDCYINGALAFENLKFNNQDLTTATPLTPGEYTSSVKFSPTVNEINKWFSKTSATSSGYFKITTLKDGAQIGSVEQVPFTISLTKDYCEKNQYLNLKDISFNRRTQNVGVFIANRSYVTVSSGYDKNSGVDIKSMKLTVTNGLLGTKTNETIKSDISLETVISNQPLQATLVVVDSRGLTYSVSGKSDSPKSYSEIQLSNINFYRSDGTKAAVLGSRIGCNFSASFSEIDNNKIVNAHVAYGSKTSEEKSSSSSLNYNSLDLFGGNYNFLTDSAYTLTIYIQDRVTSDQNLYGYEKYSNGYYTYQVNIPKAQYIIHIPQGGNGIAFGTAYTETSNQAYVDLGWPVKNLKVELNSGLKIFGSDAGTEDGFQKAIGGPFLQTGGGTMTGNLTIARSGTSGGIYIKDSTGAIPGALYYNGTNLWIGSTESATAHHNGGTYISTGYNGSKGNDSIYISIPNASNNGASAYKAYHAGNIFYSTANGDAPSSIPGGTAVKGMIWLKPIT